MGSACCLFPVSQSSPGQILDSPGVQGLALGHGLGVSSNFQVTLRVNLTRWVSLTCNFSLLLSVVVINGLYELTEIQQCDGSVMVHHLIFDATRQSFVGLPEKGMVVPLYVGC